MRLKLRLLLPFIVAFVLWRGSSYPKESLTKFVHKIVAEEQHVALGVDPLEVQQRYNETDNFASNMITVPIDSSYHSFVAFHSNDEQGSNDMLMLSETQNATKKSNSFNLTIFTDHQKLNQSNYSNTNFMPLGSSNKHNNGSFQFLQSPPSALISLSESLSRVFPVWNQSNVPYSWCHKEESSRSGILFVKLNKCASSTGVGVSLRIADTLGRRVLQQQEQNNNRTIPCFARYQHGTASTGDRQYLFRPMDRSILWSIVRHPATRVLSDFFFYQASRRKKNATQDAILKHVSDPEFQTHYVEYLKLKGFKTRVQEIQHLIQRYDFIAVSERMEESLVVLSMILKVPLADVVVLSSKESGGYDDGRSHWGCVLLKRKSTTPAIDKYLSGDFLRKNSDYILYLAVNTSLDRTIDVLGRDQVEAGVLMYRELMAKNERECRPHAIFPCPRTLPNHVYLSEQDCYFSDAGCGHACTDHALQVDSQDGWNKIRLSL